MIRESQDFLYAKVGTLSRSTLYLSPSLYTDWDAQKTFCAGRRSFSPRSPLLLFSLTPSFVDAVSPRNWGGGASVLYVRPLKEPGNVCKKGQGVQHRQTPEEDFLTSLANHVGRKNADNWQFPKPSLGQSWQRGERWRRRVRESKVPSYSSPYLCFRTGEKGSS